MALQWAATKAQPRLLEAQESKRSMALKALLLEFVTLLQRAQQLWPPPELRSPSQLQQPVAVEIVATKQHSRQSFRPSRISDTKLPPAFARRQARLEMRNAGRSRTEF